MSFSRGFNAGYGVMVDRRDRARDDDLAERIRQSAEETGVAAPRPPEQPGAISRALTGVSDFLTGGTQAPKPSTEGAAQGGRDPVDEMIRSGEGRPFQPGEAVKLADGAGSLAADIRRSAGRDPTDPNPLTRVDWNRHLENMRGIAASADPRRAATVNAQIESLERQRGAAAGRLFAAAATAAENGDNEGFARAMTAASSFMPDGFVNRFEATPQGVVLVRRSESGGQGGAVSESGQGGEQRVPMTREQMTATAMGLIDPEKQRQYLLARDQFAEAQRAARERESQGRTSLSIADRNARTGEGHLTLAQGAQQRTFANQDAEIAVTAALTTLERARAAAAANPNDPALRERVQQAETAYSEAQGRIPIQPLGAVRGVERATASEGRTSRDYDANLNAGRAQAAVEQARAQVAAANNPTERAAAERALRDAEAAVVRLRGELGAEGSLAATQGDQRNQDAAEAARRNEAQAEVNRQRALRDAARDRYENQPSEANAEALRIANAGYNEAEGQLRRLADVSAARAPELAERRAGTAETLAAAQVQYRQAQAELGTLREETRRLRAEAAQEQNEAKRADMLRRADQNDQRIGILRQEAETRRMAVTQRRNPNLSESALRNIATDVNTVLASTRIDATTQGDALREWAADFQSANRDMPTDALVRALVPYFDGTRRLSPQEVAAGRLAGASGRGINIPPAFLDGVRSGARGAGQPSTAAPREAAPATDGMFQRAGRAVSRAFTREPVAPTDEGGSAPAAPAREAPAANTPARPPGLAQRAREREEAAQAARARAAESPPEPGPAPRAAVTPRTSRAAPAPDPNAAAARAQAEAEWRREYPNEAIPSGFNLRFNRLYNAALARLQSEARR